MLKTYQFKTHCNGHNIYDSRTANIICYRTRDKTEVIVLRFITRPVVKRLNDICSFKAMTIVVTVTFRLLSFLTFIFAVLLA